jgi:hypothetical protein
VSAPPCPHDHSNWLAIALSLAFVIVAGHVCDHLERIEQRLDQIAPVTSVEAR